ncbi:MAG: hypothetical protein A3I75_04790 [Deltaproteobacteria bacterium RIFCSPLOWO2_02_FULL_50_16]|nr:MAG: hypothetical protein A3I75_04790 [Deltaproteobacteria bacterium RIFCSPLOWO2_02_FULL_50_16]OGQ66900.1 MAG: hypothetical protein A3F89_05365 [Deltaproteobacteria bacterium RIFCSPLOWO2_12_FULL_50_11]
MGTTPNFMEKNWPRTRDFLKREWPKLTDADLQWINGRFDRLVDRVREIYGGPASIIQEASIRNKLSLFFCSIEED